MLHPPVYGKKFDTIIFRNDDVAYDTDADHFKELSEVFHRFGFVQLNGIVLYGRCNDSLIVDSIPWIYDTIRPDEIYEYQKCVNVSVDFIGDNHELIDYLNSIPDPIALHGLYHSDYSQMSYAQQDQDIKKGLELLKELFPEKKVTTFIAPFNHTNDDTYKVCKKYGLRVSALEGEHLEDRLDNGKGPLYEGELYRYHHHRFYPESTFYYYNLGIQKLTQYFNKFAYTVVSRTGRAKPSLGLIHACEERHGTYHNSLTGVPYNDQDSVKRCALEYLDTEASVLQINCGQGDLLHYLWACGFQDLIGWEPDENVADIAEEIARTVGSNIVIMKQDPTNLCTHRQMDAIIYKHGAANLNEKTSYEIFQMSAYILGETGYVILDSPAESEEYLIDTAGKFNAMLVDGAPYSQEGEKKIYVFKRIKPKVCLLCDRPNWAYDNSAHELKKYLGNEFDIEIKYVIDHEKLQPNQYDIFYVFFWGETCYKNAHYSKSRIIKMVSSHRWQYDNPYGPISEEEFAEKYLDDASTIVCPSKILFETLKPVTKHLFLCGEGYPAERFCFMKMRTGEMKLCMAGNLKDPVKGVEDILKPAAEGYCLNLAQNIKYDELINFYNEHDLYVVSSKHESNPLPLIEAMACGCFPVASKIGIAPELIRHKENGYLVKARTVEEFKKAFEWCQKNIEKIRANALYISKEIHQTRRWEIMAENFRQMFRDHLGRR